MSYVLPMVKLYSQGLLKYGYLMLLIFTFLSLSVSLIFLLTPILLHYNINKPKPVEVSTLFLKPINNNKYHTFSIISILLGKK